MTSVFSEFNRPSERALLTTQGFVETHWKSYIRVVNECCIALPSIWTEVGLGLTEVESELSSIAARTTAVWNRAVAAAEQQKKDLVESVRHVEMEITTMSNQLGIPFEYDINKKSSQSLRQRFESASKIRDEFSSIKSNRVAEFKDVRTKIESVQAQFGQSIDGSADFDDPKCNLTKQSLDLLKRDLESFKIERARRLQTLESLWSILETMCIELGENPLEMMKSVHPSLEFVDWPRRTAQAGLKRVEELCFGVETSPKNWQMSPSPSLSQETFASIEDKLTWLRNERVKRESQLRSYRESLESLWEALQISSKDLERSILTRLIDGSARFHQKTLDRVQEEIQRQETAKEHVLRTLIDDKVEEMVRICESGRMEVPDFVQELLEHQQETTPRCGQFAQALGSLNRVLNETRRLAQRREEIVELIEELELAHQEVKWLMEYEQDEDRYKGRDYNRKLKRAIKAGRLRDRFPTALEQLRSVIFDWERLEHKPFILDGVNYREEMLDRFEEVLPPPQEEPKASTQSGRRHSLEPTSSKGAKLTSGGKKGLSRTTSSKGRNLHDRGSSLLRPRTSVAMTRLSDGLFGDSSLGLDSPSNLSPPHSIPSPSSRTKKPSISKSSLKKQQNEGRLFRTKTPSSARGDNKKASESSREMEVKITRNGQLKGRKSQDKTSLAASKLTQNPFQSSCRKLGGSNKSSASSRRTSL